MNESRETLQLQPYDWGSSDRDNIFSIRIWTHNRNSERVLLRVEDYEPFIRIELPSIVGGKQVLWNTPSLKVYTSWIRKVLGAHEPTRILYKELQKIYWYRNQTKHPFLICYFQTEEAMIHCTRLINKKGYQIPNLGYIRSRVWETSISSIHRFITDTKLGYGQWFEAEVQKVDELDKISICQHEYMVSYKNIRSLTEEECKGWITNPLVAAVDIECYSSNHRKMPNENFATDVVFQISYITQRLGDISSRKKYLLALNQCDSIDGAEVLIFRHEIELMDGLCDLITKSDPTIITGYNIFRFDFPYMDARMKLYMRDWRSCSLIKDENTYINIRKWKSSAYGQVIVSTIEAEGRLCIDMYPIIKRDYKLDRYTLDFVCNHFLGKGKHDVTPQQMFQTYEKLSDGLSIQNNDIVKEASHELSIVGAYCLEDSCLCIDLMERLNTWIMLVELSTIVQVTVMQVFTRGQQLRVQNQVYSTVYHDDFVMDERTVPNTGFKGAYVVDTIPGKYRNVLLLDFASLYPSIMRAFNICYSTLVPPESNIPDSMCHVLAWTENDESGNVKYFRHRFIKQQYFHGILPRMCEHLVNARKETRSQIGPQNDEVTNIVLNQRQLGLKISANSIFGSLGVKVGRLPLPEGAHSVTSMGRELILMAGKYVEEKYNGQIVAGDTDSIMVNLNIQDPHECATIGRKLEKELSDLYPDPLYLELDATFAIALFIKKKKYAGVLLKNIKLLESNSVEEVSFEEEYNNSDLQLYQISNSSGDSEYMGIPKKVSIKNRNVLSGIPLLKGGAPNKKELMKKGIILARRDNCLWMREAYLKILLNILFDKPLVDTLELIDKEILKMMTRAVPFEKMLLTQEIGRNYKENSTHPMKIFVDELRKEGHPAKGGERIDYIFVRRSDPKKNLKQGYKMRIPDLFWQRCQQEPLDTLNYVKKMKNPVEQILYLGYKAEIDANEKRCEPKIRRRGRIYTYVSHKYVETWIKLICQKDVLIDTIKKNRPHFQSQRPYYIQNFEDDIIVVPSH